MYIIIHTFQTCLGNKVTTLMVRKTVPVEFFDENTLSVIVFTKEQAAADYFDMLYENSKITQGDRNDYIDILHNQVEDYLCRM